ncbi:MULTISPECIES: autotransporter outer membrane beta-barrel domain-containing protein [unclassified Pseudomonas]|uniref:autotransporter outer membrane beta-barrel domain-containing protein n=1 Tax=unclassified Pseudomonas TaxID=196821 RepID=UPI002E8230B0|nr:autotransporter outer membrane beta-barrel domain-containing protein [Pseudomonas sp. 10C3]MEE3505385.1 autotransporter outer membrane beta-barrel domain-containing protein [Pseudomonas sp. 10C3]
MKRFKGQAGQLVMVLGVITANVCEAAIDVPPGQNVVIRDGDPVYEFNLQDSHLIVKAGGETGRIHATADSRLEMDGGRVTSTGEPAIALYNSRAVINNSTIIAEADPARPDVSSFGIRLSGFEQASSAHISNSFVSGTDRGINVTDSASLELFNTHVEGHAGASGIGFVSGGAGVVVAGASASFNQNSVVTGDNNGVVIWGDATGATERPASLVVDQSSVVGLEGSAIVITRSAAANQDVHIDIRNGSTLSGGNGIALEVNNAATGYVAINDSQLVGDVLVTSDSIAHLSLANNASLTGAINNATTLNIDGSSTWLMEGNSTVGKLELNGGSVDLRGTSDGFQTLTVGELNGSGTFALGTDLAAQKSDFLDVTGSATGSHQLRVQNTGIDPLEGADPQQIVHTGSGDAQFSLVGDKVDFGTFAYELEQQENSTGGTDWSLVQTGEVSAGSRSVIGLFSAAPTVWYGESATLRSRMGELRNGGDQGGGWMRSYGNKYKLSAGGGVSYSQVQQGISFGADAPLPSSNGQWLAGLMGGYSKSDLDLKEGTTGEVDSYYIGAYTTWLADDGFYVDALIKANRFQNSSDVVMRDGEKSKGTYTNHGIGVSVEAGKRIKLNEDWFIEPFAQVSGLWVSGQDYDLDNGMQASSNKADSLMAKVGTHAGRKFALTDGGFVQPYVKVAAAREFLSSNQVSINGNRFTNDLSGSRAELGAGIAAQLTDVLQVHADFDYMKGNNIEQPWGMNVGLRYSW